MVIRFSLANPVCVVGRQGERSIIACAGTRRAAAIQFVSGSSEDHREFFASSKTAGRRVIFQCDHPGRGATRPDTLTCNF